MKTKKVFNSVVLAIILSFGCQSIFADTNEKIFSTNKLIFVEQFLRTELYFGTDKNDGSKVTDEDWYKFLSEAVTPKFPNGLTVLEGYGQFRDSGGKIVRENSRILILLYPLKNRVSASRKIEQIRTDYKRVFHQESVLRIDFRQSMRISF